MNDLETLVSEQADALKNLGLKLKEEIEYAKLCACLDLLAGIGITATYGQIGRIVGLFAGSAKLARLLGRKMSEDAAASRPLTCALVVGVDAGVPGDGFFAMAKKVGYTIADEQAFWAQQRDACFAASK